MWSWTSRNSGNATPALSNLIHMNAEGRPNKKIAAPVIATDFSRLYPWSTKFLTQSSTVEIIEVKAAKDNARKNPVIIMNGPTVPPGA